MAAVPQGITQSSCVRRTNTCVSLVDNNETEQGKPLLSVHPPLFVLYPDITGPFQCRLYQNIFSPVSASGKDPFTRVSLQGDIHSPVCPNKRSFATADIANKLTAPLELTQQWAAVSGKVKNLVVAQCHKAGGFSWSCV